MKILNALALGTKRATRVASLIAALGFAACSIDDALTVPDPDVAKPGSLDSKAALPVLRTGAIGDFARAFGGGGDTESGLIQEGGLLADELEWAETFPTRREFDSRNMQITNTSLGATFRNPQRARASAERAARAFEKFDATNPQRAEMNNLEGLSIILMAEAFCSGVPFSELTPEGETVFGEPLTTVQMFNAAVAAFDKALAQVGTGTSATAVAQANLARVGRARALLNLGQFAAAGTAAGPVPTTFQYITEHSENSSRQNNGVFVVMAINRRFSVADREGTNGLPFRSDNDPRTLSPRGTGAAAVGFDGTTPLFLPAKYPNRSASIVVASGTEARLIEAEAAYQAGNFTQMFSILNALRSSISLPALTDPGTAAGRVDVLFKERAYWMFLTAHRLGDLRRLVRQYGRNREAVFPTGAYPASKGGGAYGSDVNFVIPFDEINNPKFTQCLDRNP